MCVTTSHQVNANIDQLVTRKVVTAALHQAIVFLEKRDGQDQESSQGGVIEFLSTIPLVIHLCIQEILAWLDHWLNLVDYMNYLPETGSKHSLHSWLPSVMNSGIYMSEACTLINYTQPTICT